MKELGVGDRVRVYTWDPEDESMPLVFKAEVTGEYHTGMVKVTPDSGEHEALKYPDWCVHPKQCRKLVRRERQRIWVEDQRGELTTQGNLLQQRVWLFRPPSIGVPVREFVEVRRKK